MYKILTTLSKIFVKSTCHSLLKIQSSPAPLLGILGTNRKPSWLFLLGTEPIHISTLSLHDPLFVLVTDYTLRWQIGKTLFVLTGRAHCQRQVAFFTPHVCDVSGVIVLTSSVCVCVCLSVTTLTAKRSDIQT